MTECPYSNEVLIDRLKTRDGPAWDWLYGRFGPMVFAVAVKKLRESEARDVTQKVFVELLRVLEQGAQIQNLGGFLHKIAVRRTLDALKKQILEESRGRPIDGSGEDGESSGPQIADGRAAAPSDGATADEDRVRIAELTAKVLEGLSPAERMAAELLVGRIRGDHELSWEEIREQVRGQHHKTVNLARVFEKFRSAFARGWEHRT